MSCTAGFGERPCAAVDGSILAVGDSIFAYNSGDCESAPDVVGALLGRDVFNAARSGAMISPEERWIFGDIREAYVAGDWSHVIVEGGVNDLNFDCDCAGCDDVLDRTVAAGGGGGAMPTLGDRALSDGAEVVLVGYYEMGPEATNGVDVCNPAIGELNTRYELVAAGRDGVTFVNPGEVVSMESTPDAYRSDQVHPTAEGSVLLAELIAAAIED